MTISALSLIEGKSLSQNVPGKLIAVIPSLLTTCAPKIYNPILVARSLTYSRSSSFIVPSGFDENKVKGAMAK